VELWGAAADMGLSSKPYLWKKGTGRKSSGSLKWLIPLVAYGQVRPGSSVLGAGWAG